MSVLDPYSAQGVQRETHSIIGQIEGGLWGERTHTVHARVDYVLKLCGAEDQLGLTGGICGLFRAESRTQSLVGLGWDWSFGICMHVTPVLSPGLPCHFY